MIDTGALERCFQAGKVTGMVLGLGETGDGGVRGKYLP